MASYNIPPDTSAKEKIIGGFLSIAQLMWVLIGIAFGCLIGFILKPALDMTGFIIGLVPGLAGAAIMCFVKIHQLTVWQFITFTQKHKKRTKQLPNIRMEGMTQEEKDALMVMNLKTSNRVEAIKAKPKTKKKGLFVVEHVQ